MPHKKRSTGADDPETTGAWETVTVSTPSCCSRLVRRLLSTDRKRSEDRSDCKQSQERQGGLRGHGDLPDEHMEANAPTETDSGLKPQPVTPRAVQARPAAVRIPQPVTEQELTRRDRQRSEDRNRSRRDRSREDSDRDE